MVKLADLLYQFRNQKSLERVITLSQIRAYVAAHNVQTVLAEIANVNNEMDCNTLVGAGMRNPLYLAVLKRKAELMGI